MTPATRSLLLLPALILQGCITVGPDYVPPEPSTPDLWHQELTRGLTKGEANLHNWWSVFEDPILDTMIERAASGNLDLQEAVFRIAESQARRGIASGERFPDADGVGSAQRSRVSEGLADPFVENRTDNIYSVGLDSSWEVDLWGRITRSIESADASLQASVEDYRDVLVLLYSNIALNYIEARALQARIRFAEANVGTQRGSLKLSGDRNRAGLVGDLDVRQAEQNLASTESFIPQLRQRLAEAIHRIGVLIGQAPATLWAELGPVRKIPDPPERILVGLPTELLRQRPDIRRAERALGAQTARIGLATADLYPRFSLLGTFTFEELSGGDLFDWESRAFAFGPSMRWNLFDGGRVRNSIRVQDALTEQLLRRYENTVLQSLEEVENALVAYVQESIRRDALERSVVASRKAVELVNTLYRTGLTDFQNVLDSERTLFQEEDSLAESEGLVGQNLVRIYRSLGGGWSPTTPLPTVP